MRKMLRENLSLKLASLALAILVWFYVRGEQQPVQIFTVPLHLQGLAPDLAVSGEVADTVSVRVQAPEVVLRTISPEKLVARVDLSNLGAGDQTARVRPESIPFPASVDILRVTPEQIPLRIERKSRRDLPVKPRVDGKPADGCILGAVLIDPPRVTVSGPESAVLKARAVEADIVRIDGRSSPFEAVVDLYPDRAGVTLEGPFKAQISVDIHERYVTRAIPGVKVVVEGAEGAPVQVRLRPQSVNVTLEGPPEAIADLEERLVTVVVDVRSVPQAAGEYRVKPRVVVKPDALAKRLTVLSVSAEEIEVRVLGRRGR